MSDLVFGFNIISLMTDERAKCYVYKLVLVIFITVVHVLHTNF